MNRLRSELMTLPYYIGAFSSEAALQRFMLNQYLHNVNVNKHSFIFVIWEDLSSSNTLTFALMYEDSIWIVHEQIHYNIIENSIIIPRLKYCGENCVYYHYINKYTSPACSFSSYSHMNVDLDLKTSLKTKRETFTSLEDYVSEHRGLLSLREHETYKLNRFDCERHPLSLYKMCLFIVKNYFCLYKQNDLIDFILPKHVKLDIIESSL